MSTERRLGTHIDRARQELPDAWAGLDPDEPEFVAECDELWRNLKGGLPLGAFEKIARS
jgi:hypothetical protein